MIKPQLLSDVLTKEYADAIEDKLLSVYFPWYFIEDVTRGTQDAYSKNPAFKHQFMLNGKVNSDAMEFVAPIAVEVGKRLGLVEANVLQCRSFLQLPSSSESKVNNKHVDMKEPHLVFLYYINDSDGDTILYDGDEVLMQVSPKKNSALVFDGSLYHSSSTPTMCKRAVINFNISMV